LTLAAALVCGAAIVLSIQLRPEKESRPRGSAMAP
jgi:hypothetical protein